MRNEKHYQTNVKSDHEYEIPNVATFVIDEATAKEIIRLAAMVKENSLYKVEKFDYRVAFLDAEGERIRMEAECLNISETEFWFSAYIKHTDIEVRTETQWISALATHFGLIPEPTNVSEDFYIKCTELSAIPGV